MTLEVVEILPNKMRKQHFGRNKKWKLLWNRTFSVSLRERDHYWFVLESIKPHYTWPPLDLKYLSTIFHKPLVSEQVQFSLILSNVLSPVGHVCWHFTGFGSNGNTDKGAPALT